MQPQHTYFLDTFTSNEGFRWSDLLSQQQTRYQLAIYYVLEIVPYKINNTSHILQPDKTREFKLLLTGKKLSSVPNQDLGDCPMSTLFTTDRVSIGFFYTNMTNKPDLQLGTGMGLFLVRKSHLSLLTSSLGRKESFPSSKKNVM